MVQSEPDFQLVSYIFCSPRGYIDSAFDDNLEYIYDILDRKDLVLPVTYIFGWHFYPRLAGIRTKVSIY